MVLGTFVASVPSTATYGMQQLIRLNQPVITGVGVTTALPVIVDNAVHVAGFFGDVNASQTYTAADTALLQRVILVSGSGFSAYRTIDPVIIADLNHSTTLSAVDVGLLMRVILGASEANVPGFGILLSSSTVQQNSLEDTLMVR
jgi:hypothetical protein